MAAAAAAAEPSGSTAARTELIASLIRHVPSGVPERALLTCATIVLCLGTVFS